MPGFRRKPNRLPPASYRGQHAYFLTLCTRERKRLFQDPPLVDALFLILRQTCSSHFFGVYAYCFMPDHLHLILSGQTVASDLASMVQAFKSLAAAAARKIGVFNLWEKGFYDHVLRTGKSLDAAAWYVFMNPVRAGLAKTPEDWPYSGSLVFEWRTLAAPSEHFDPPWKKTLAR